MGIEKIAADKDNILESLSDAVVTFEGTQTLTVKIPEWISTGNP